MKINKFSKYKVVLIVFILLLMFFSCISSCFAASTFDYNYEHTYNFKIDNDFTYTCGEGSTSVSNFSSYVNSNLNDDRVKSGDYYYFVFNQLWKGVTNVLVKKSAVDRIAFIHRLTRNDLNTVLYDLHISEEFSSSDVIFLNGNKELDNKGLISVGFYCDSSTQTLITNFATNYDGNIYIDCSNNEKKLFFLGAPLTQGLASVETMEIFQTLMKKLVVSLLVFLIGLIGLRKAWIFLRKALHKA